MVDEIISVGLALKDQVICFPSSSQSQRVLQEVGCRDMGKALPKAGATVKFAAARHDCLAFLGLALLASWPLVYPQSAKN